MTFQGAGVMIDELQIFAQALTPIEAAQLFDGNSLTDAFAKKADLGDFYTQRSLRLDETRRSEIAAIQQSLLSLEDALPEFPVLRQRPTPPPEDSARPASIFAAPDRLKFAQALNRNLLARSLANTVWEAHFGSPLAHDLGHGGKLPQHPDLLEWLAGKLVEFNYDPNKLAALIQDSNLWLREWPVNHETSPACPRPLETP